MTEMKNFNNLLNSLLYSIEELELSLKKTYGVLNDVTITELHCIENIGKIENPNVTKLSNALNITRGGVSKLIKKIIKKGLIETYSNENNRKEIYYKLTELGIKIFDAHENIHKKWNKRDEEFFKNLTQEEIQTGINFITKYTQHTKETLKDFNRS